MRSLEQARKYEALVDGQWVPVHWEQLDKGDIVRCCPQDVLDGPMSVEFIVANTPGLEADDYNKPVTEPVCDCHAQPHAESCPVTSYVRAAFAASGESAQGSSQPSKEWPTLESFHLQAVVFAYNEGYSKAYDRRIFPNPFATSGSQAAAYTLGVKDGSDIRDRDDRIEAEQAVRKDKAAINRLLAEVEWVRTVLSEYGYSGPLTEADCPLRELLSRKSGSPTEIAFPSLWVTPSDMEATLDESFASSHPVTGDLWKQAPEQIALYADPVAYSAGDTKDAFDAADRAINNAYPDFDNKGPGFWGAQRIPNFGILRGSIVRELTLARCKKAKQVQDTADKVRATRIQRNEALIPDMLMQVDMIESAQEDDEDGADPVGVILINAVGALRGSNNLINQQASYDELAKAQAAAVSTDAV